MLTCGNSQFFWRVVSHTLKLYPDLTEEEAALATMQIEPFGAECRAYGRLKETGQEHLAAKAYGYVELLINERTRAMFEPYKHVLEPWADLDDLFDCPERRGPEEQFQVSEPIMGIVKEWVDDPWFEEPLPPPAPVPVAMLLKPDAELEAARASVRARHDQRLVDCILLDKAEQAACPRLLRNLHQLHKHGIVMRDIQPAQYVDGKLVDFSYSWTFPLVLARGGPSRPDWSSASFAARDLYDFQHNIIDIIDRDMDRHAKQISKDFQGEIPRFKKSRLVAYPEPAGREGLRPLPQRQRKNRPLLHYVWPYNPDGDEQHPLLIPWTHGPRFDPGKFDLSKVMSQRAPEARVTRRRSRAARPKSTRSKKG